MANKVIHKRSSTKGQLPTGSTLECGEIAVNFNSEAPFLSIKDNKNVYRKFIDETAVNDKITTEVNKKANTEHEHNASDITGGTLSINLIPTGATNTTVAIGNHDHDSTYLKSESYKGTLTGITVTGASGLTGSGTVSKASGKTGGTITLGHAPKTVAVSTTATTLAHSGEFIVPTVTYDEYGHISGLTNTTYTLPSDNNTAHSHSAGVGLTGSGNAGTSGTYTYKVNLVNETKSASAASASTSSQSNRLYPVSLDKDGKLAVNVPWTDTNDDTKVTSEANHYTPSATTTDLTADATGGTASWNTSVVSGVNLQRDSKGHIVGVTVDSVKIPSQPTDSDTKNTAGADNTSSKIFLVGTTSQTTNNGSARTYSHDTAYVGTDGCLYSNKTKVKVVQTAVTSPTASGNATAFIDTISQDANGVITATKKNITAADLGLSGAMRYIGMVEGLSDGDPSDIITINGVDITPEPGNVVIDTNLHKEYIWNGDCWEELGSEGNYKVKQNAVTINNYGEPTTYTTTSFIYTLSQDENGVISGKLGKIPIAKQNEQGIVKLCNGDITNYSYNDGEAAAAEHNHDSKYKTIQTNVTSPSASGNTTSFIDTISQDANGVITATKKTVPTAKYNTLGIIKPSKSYTGAATLKTAAASASTAPTINAITTTAGKYYAVEVDKNGVPFVNVPWTDTNDDTSTTETGHYKPSTTASTIGATSGDNYIRGIHVDSKNHVISVATGTPANTHYTSKNIVGTSTTATTNGAVTGTGGVYLNHLEESTVKSTHKIIGSGSVKVTSDNNGNITINGTEYCPTYHVATTTADRDKYGYGSTNQWGHVRLVNGDLSVVTGFTAGLAAAHYHNHNGAYVSKAEFEDNELVVSQALNDLNEAISGVETSISDCVTAPIVNDTAMTTMETPWVINTPALMIGNEENVADGSGFVVVNMGGDGHIMSVPNVMFGKWIFGLGDNTEYIYYDVDDEKLKRYWSNGDSTMRFSFATEDWVEDQVSMDYVTYSQLKELRDNSQLVPGKQYRITDYVTTTTLANTQSAGHQFDVIVTADSYNTFNEVARAIQHQGDTYFSDSDLNAWQIWYCFDNDKERFPWAKTDSKKITVMLDTVALTGEYIGTYTFEGTTYHKWDTLYEGMVVSLLTISDSPNVGDTIVGLAIISLGVAELAPLPITNVQEGGNDEGYGVIYRMIDEHNNDLPYDFKNIQFVRKLTNGVLDLDNGTDEFVFTFNVFDEDSGAHYDHSLGEVCYGNIIKKSSYGLNNIVFLNVMQEDYKNSIANIFGDECFNMTFGSNAVSNIFGVFCHENTFEEESTYNTFGRFCYGNTFGGECYNNKFGDDCRSSTFGKSFANNIIGNNCYDNTFGDYCYYNTFGVSCFNNTFGNHCENNTFRSECYGNTFGASCQYNTFGDICLAIHFGNSCYYNTVGNYCSVIFIGNMCQYNTFGSGCSDFYFGSSENDLLSYCRYIIVDNGSARFGLNTTQTTNTSKYLQKIHISAMIPSFEYYNRIFNVDTIGQDYTIEIAMNSAGVIKQFCLADLIA